jgi:hypothetical protein
MTQTRHCAHQHYIREVLIINLSLYNVSTARPDFGGNSGGCGKNVRGGATYSSRPPWKVGAKNRIKSTT